MKKKQDMLHRLSEIQTVVKQESSYVMSINFKGWWRIDEHTKTSSGLYLSSDNDNRIVSKTKYEVVWKGEMPSGVLAYELNKEFRIYFRDLNPTALPLYMWLNGQRLFFTATNKTATYVDAVLDSPLIINSAYTIKFKVGW